MGRLHRVSESMMDGRRALALANQHLPSVHSRSRQWLARQQTARCRRVRTAAPCAPFIAEWKQCRFQVTRARTRANGSDADEAVVTCPLRCSLERARRPERQSREKARAGVPHHDRVSARAAAGDVFRPATSASGSGGDKAAPSAFRPCERAHAKKAQPRSSHPNSWHATLAPMDPARSRYG